MILILPSLFWGTLTLVEAMSLLTVDMTAIN